MNNNCRFAKHSATMGPVGWFPAPGTCATSISVLFIYWANYAALSLVAQLAVVLLVAVLSHGIITRALPHFGVSDPKQIVLDELVGSLVALLMVPGTIGWYLVATIMFRIADIYKPCGIRYLEKIPGALGIIADDVAAGVGACLVVHLLRYGLSLV